MGFRFLFLRPGFAAAKAMVMLVLVAFVAPVTFAQKATVDYVLPQVEQQGTEVKVWMRGARLQTAEQVLFYKAGIRCTKIEHARFAGGLHLAGFDTGVISSTR